MKTTGFKDPTKICHGIDVSAWQGEVNFDDVKVKSAFSFLKATEGVTYLSADYYREWEDAKNNGVLRGAYHYFKYSVDPEAQAEFFLSKVSLLEGDLPLMCDWEDPAAQSAGDMIAYAEAALIFMKILEQKTGLKPFFYTYPGFFGEIENTPMADKFAEYPLWIAHYGVQAPWTPKQWVNWTIWQYAADYFLDADDPKIDANWFNGTIEDLKAMCLQPSSPQVDSIVGVPDSLNPEKHCPCCGSLIA